MKYLNIISYLLLMLASNCKLESRQISLSIVSIKTDSSKSRTSYVAQVKMVNDLEHNYLLYGFHRNQLSNSEEDRLCTMKHVSAGFAVFIWNMEGERMYEVVQSPGRIDFQPNPEERLKELMINGKGSYLTGTVISSGNSSVKMNVLLDLKHYFLKKGTYKIQLIYFSGPGVFHEQIVGRDQISKDEHKFNGVLFQGCLRTNIVTFESN